MPAPTPAEPSVPRCVTAVDARLTRAPGPAKIGRLRPPLAFSTPTLSMPHRLVRYYCGAIAAIALDGCLFSGSKHVAPAPAPLSVRDSIVALDIQRGALGAGREWVEVSSEPLAEDVIYLAPGAPLVVGRDAARTILATQRPAADAIVAYEPLVAGISRDGRAGFTYGSRITTLPSAAANDRVRVARYIAYWRLTPSGWRIAAYSDVGGDPIPPGIATDLVTPRPSLMRQHAERAENAVRMVWQTDSLFSLAADREGAAAAFAGNVADYGATFAGTLLVVGPQAVRAELEAHRNGSLTWSPVYADAAESADLGFTVGDYVFTGPGASGAVTQRFGKYLTIWKLQSDGHWKFVVDGGNASPPRTQ